MDARVKENLHWNIFLTVLLFFYSFKRQYMAEAGAKIRDKGEAGEVGAGAENK